VVGGPVVLAGNSIGGFISASMAADFPDLVAGLVLLNSAGPIKPDFDLAAFQVRADFPSAEFHAVMPPLPVLCLAAVGVRGWYVLPPNSIQ
jgi:pimeloyl-ACP methyl ester carboxylesterase